jgi:hypothetical protein
MSFLYKKKNKSIFKIGEVIHIELLDSKNLISKHDE